jgi:hypothetical protein
MEIRNFERVDGVEAVADIVEGRFVIKCANTDSYDFGSKRDIAGVRVPNTAEEAKRAKYVITWPVDNRQPPIYQPNPAFSWALRGGFDQAANSPFKPDKVYLTYPGYTNGATIPSGNLALAFTDGVFTIPSGGFVDSADIEVVGAMFTIQYGTGADAGKPIYCAADAVGVIGTVERFDSTTYSLTVRVD